MGSILPHIFLLGKVGYRIDNRIVVTYSLRDLLSLDVLVKKMFQLCHEIPGGTVRRSSHVNLWDRCSVLHPIVQITLVIGALVLLTVIAKNHSPEENLVKLLLAVQAILLNSKTRGWRQPK